MPARSFYKFIWNYFTYNYSTIKMNKYTLFAHNTFKFCYFLLVLKIDFFFWDFYIIIITFILFFSQKSSFCLVLILNVYYFLFLSWFIKISDSFLWIYQNIFFCFFFFDSFSKEIIISYSILFNFLRLIILWLIFLSLIIIWLLTCSYWYFFFVLYYFKIFI